MASSCDATPKAAKQVCSSDRTNRGSTGAGRFPICPSAQNEALRANVVALADRFSRTQRGQDFTRNFERVSPNNRRSGQIRETTSVRISMRRFLITVVAVLLITSSIAPSLTAAPVTGSIDFGGVVTFDTMSLATAKRVSVWNSSFVLQDSGSFSSIAPGTNVMMAAPWIFNPSTATPSLWSVGGFTFDLTSASVATQNANFLNVTGLGTVSGNGFDPTPGLWSFSSSNSNGSNSTTFGFQATTDPVPESSTVVLLATGALLFTGLHYFRRKAEAT